MCKIFHKILKSIKKEENMYAIAFNLEQDTLSEIYVSPTHSNAYSEIKRVLGQYGFTQQYGSIYFGDAEKVDTVKCVLAV